jgi:hypothetical protein
VFLRVRNRSNKSVEIAALRDEFLDRPWDPPGMHWSNRRLVGGRDRRSGGTWLAAAADSRAVAVVVNGPGMPPAGVDPASSRGSLPLRLLEGVEPDGADLARLPGFHLVHATPRLVRVFGWDGVALTITDVPHGDHTVTFGGVDAEHPRVRRCRPLLANVRTGDDWLALLSGGGHDPAAPDALVIRRTESGRPYGTTSAALLTVSAPRLTYRFTDNPSDPGSWRTVV